MRRCPWVRFMEMEIESVPPSAAALAFSPAAFAFRGSASRCG